MSEKTPDSIAAHTTRDEFEVALFTLLRDHFGEDVGGQRSIDSSKAVLHTLPVVSQLMAQWSPKERREVIRAFEQGTTNLSLRILREYEARERMPRS